jgi:hypothetical protein
MDAMVRLTATEMVRDSSTGAELHRLARPQRVKGAAWRRFVASLPRVDADFAKDVEHTRKSVGPSESRWPDG